jgi:glucosamine-6-phosphate deaminase
VELVNRKVENLTVRIFDNRDELGKAAAEDAGKRIAAVLEKKGEATVVFAAAPSQNEMLAYLKSSTIEWSKIRAMHMEEYIGLPVDHPAGFGNFLRRAIFTGLRFKEVHYLWNGIAVPEKACASYSQLLEQFPPDLVLLGVGENGHLAFNDPPVADFDDPRRVKIVELDAVCRRQQVNDGCFSAIAEVPTHAMTLTMSAIYAIPSSIVVVPGIKKADAINRMVHEEVTTACPASILKRHTDSTLYLDTESASLAFPDERRKPAF